MSQEEVQKELEKLLNEGAAAVHRWYSHAGITPEINIELSDLTKLKITTFYITSGGQLNQELTNLVKCVIEAAFQYGRRFPLINWQVVEETKNEATN